MPTPASFSAEQSAAHRREMQLLVNHFFADPAELGQFTAVDSDHMPEDYARLLAHDEHMTVSLEEFYAGSLSVHVVRESKCTEYYARCSLLSRQSDDRIVQFGVMRIDLAGLPIPVRRAIESHTAPLGRILIEHGLLREVELLALWEIEPGTELNEHLPVSRSPIYGRSAQIHVEGEPSVDLLEIVCL